MTTELSRPAYRCTDKDVVAAFRAAFDEYITSERAASAAAARDFPDAKGLRIALGQWGVADHLVGIIPDDPRSEPPAGWRVRGRRRVVYFAPQGGPAGEAARKWLHEHRLRNDPRLVLRGFGLPQNGRKLTSKADGSFYATRPVLFDHDDTVWAMFAGTPDRAVDARWEPVRMSAWYAAHEAYDDAQRRRKERAEP